MLITFSSNNIKKIIAFAEQERLRSLCIDGMSSHISYSLFEEDEIITANVGSKLLALKSTLVKLCEELENNNMPLKVSITFGEIKYEDPSRNNYILKTDIVWNNHGIKYMDPEESLMDLIEKTIELAKSDIGKGALSIPGIVRYGQGKKKGTVCIIDALQMIKELL